MPPVLIRRLGMMPGDDSKPGALMSAALRTVIAGFVLMSGVAAGAERVQRNAEPAAAAKALAVDESTLRLAKDSRLDPQLQALAGLAPYAGKAARPPRLPVVDGRVRVRISVDDATRAVRVTCPAQNASRKLSIVYVIGFSRYTSLPASSPIRSGGTCE